jgi:hypothetical protein
MTDVGRGVHQRTCGQLPQPGVVPAAAEIPGSTKHTTFAANAGRMFLTPQDHAPSDRLHTARLEPGSTVQFVTQSVS